MKGLTQQVKEGKLGRKELLEGVLEILMEFEEEEDD